MDSTLSGLSLARKWIAHYPGITDNQRQIRLVELRVRSRSALRITRAIAVHAITVIVVLPPMVN
uniref:Bm11164 n=1 Tax=Brugia malayi TaxID=6279 RepID=A0A1I9G8T3_BRUMA|nr:Bm11164 [Brugia malayi]